jgi:hypothetical protein
MIISTEKIEKIFTEWDRRYRENPCEFMTDPEMLINETPYSIGKLSAAYFMKLSKEV